jgi:single-strand DNA-binding protein
MANFNKVILAGNLTRDPELSYTPSNKPVCKFGLGVNSRWTDRQTNEKHEETMFVDCTAWSRNAETIKQYLRKGSPILIEGKLVHETWTNAEGQKRSKHTVTVWNFQFLGGPGAGGERPGGPPVEAEGSRAPADQPGPDDVPF